MRLPIRLLSCALVAALLLALPATTAGARAVPHGHHVMAAVALADKRPVRAGVAGAQCASAGLVPTADNLALVQAAILCLHNQIRARHGLPLLRTNAKLEGAARGHSVDMVSRGYFDHTAPGGSTMVDRILSARYARRDQGWSLGENLAWGTGSLGTPQGVMTAWMNSAGHRANILHRSYREVGIGVVVGVPGDGAHGATYTADFGARR